MLLLALLSPALAVSPPSFSEDPGIRETAFTLELSAEAGASILYGIGAGDPTEAWPGSLEIDGSTIVRAVAVADDGTSSAVATHTWLWVDEVAASAVMDPDIVADPVYGLALADTLRELPTVSLVLGADLSTTEQQASMEWIDPYGEIVQLDCGVRKVGGHSLNYDKNNLRLNFRSSYGEGKLDLDLYADPAFATGVPPADQHDALNLRGGSHDSVFYLGSRGQYMRNRWMDETQLEMGHVAPHGRYAHVYVDGVYNGLFHVRERFDAGFMSAYFGGEEDDYEAVNGGTAVDGTGSAWAQVVALRDDYEAVEDWLNVENFLDYMVLNFYAANDWDWNPDQNWMAAGPVDPGQGGFIFHSSDSDICLYYDWDTNLLHESGPDYVFAHLLAQAHPDFLVLLEDRIFLALKEEGPLSTDAAIDRYQRLAERIEGAVVAESARWGQGWWDRDDEWVTERDNLVESWFPYRTAEQLRQFREAGWYPLDAPAVSVAPGLVTSGSEVELAVTADFPTAEVWVRPDGGDPRLPGGALAPEASGGFTVDRVTVAHSTLLTARLRQGETWGPLRRGFYELDQAPPVVLNEWNAVEPGRLLDDSAGDRALGRIAGNGGDWIELLVVADHTDLRGWTLSMQDRAGPAGTLVFTDADVLADLRSGTVLTIAEDLPQDTAYDPEAGDWRFHLRAGIAGDGTVISATAFDVTHREWQLTIQDADGFVAFGPAGEGVAPEGGINGDEVGRLEATPDTSTRRWDPAYDDGDSSTFGSENRWGDGQQDLSDLRAVVEGSDAESDTGGDTGTAGDGGSGADGGAAGGAALDTRGDEASGCGCSSSSGGGGAGLLALLVPLLAVRRRRLLLVAGLTACAGGTSLDRGSSLDSGPSREAGSALDGGSPLDGGGSAGPAGCFLDVDGDGWGGEDLTDCESGVNQGGDCDDAEPSVHPGATEHCDEVDEDCDGAVDDDPIDGLPFYADADGDGWGSSKLRAACTLDEGLALVDGDCDDGDATIHPDAAESCDGIDQDCDGSSEDGLGLSEACPASSCLDLLEEGDSDSGIDDGAYWLLLPTGTVSQVWCDQTRDGGGWTLGFSRNTVGTGSQGDFGAGEVEVDGLDLSDEEASSSTESRLAWQDLNLLDWTQLRLTAAYDGSRTYASESISRDSLRISFGEDGYLLYGEEGYWWCGGDASYTDSGVGAVDNPTGAPSDCRGHSSLGSGWDFSDSTTANQGLTLCGGDGSSFLAASWGGSWVTYGSVGGSQAIWVR